MKVFAGERCEDLWTDKGTKFLQGITGPDTPKVFYANEFKRKAQIDEENESFELLIAREYLMQKGAKEHAGFKAALTLPYSHPNLGPAPLQKHLEFN